jgi:hypothetical protein
MSKIVFNLADVPILSHIAPATVEAFISSLNLLPVDFASAFETYDNR